MTHFLGMRHYILRHSVLSTYLKSRQQEESIVQKQGLLLESVMKVILTIVTPMCVFFLSPPTYIGYTNYFIQFLESLPLDDTFPHPLSLFFYNLWARYHVSLS